MVKPIAKGGVELAGLVGGVGMSLGTVLEGYGFGLGEPFSHLMRSCKELCVRFCVKKGVPVEKGGTPWTRIP